MNYIESISVQTMPKIKGSTKVEEGWEPAETQQGHRIFFWGFNSKKSFVFHIKMLTFFKKLCRSDSSRKLSNQSKKMVRRLQEMESLI
jgi:hypothetical protein